MTYGEQAIVFVCGGDSLVGIVANPVKPSTSLGVLIIVGGPQYRVGSHRQFVLLSRHLAEQGIPSMRFDCRGMGDATGVERSFEDIDDDIRAAVDCFFETSPGLEKVVLWGLWDGASAACLYAPKDSRVAGLVLLNPWVRTEVGEARTYLKHYYLRRLLQPDFWKKLWGRQFAIGRSARDLLRSLRIASASRPAGTASKAEDLPSRMAAAAADARLPMLLILSGNDYVANEFDEVCADHTAWSALVADAAVSRLDTADHTFSRAEWRDAVAETTAGWVLSYVVARSGG